jgi:hypothetical protein
MGQAEKRANEQGVVWAPRGRYGVDAAKTARARAAHEPQQHCLDLIVDGVP